MKAPAKAISVVISSLRPERLEITIDKMESERDLVEVVVVSPYPPKPRDFVVHIPVPAPGTPGELTFVQKFNLGAREAHGEFIVFNNDDIHLRTGWAAALIRHMEAAVERPYLAAFQIAQNGTIIARHTIFGLLYGNHGCIRKADLALVGNTLLDERIFMYYSELDLALRVWSAGGRVAMCPEVVMDCDFDIDQMRISGSSKFAQETKTAAAPTKKPSTYRDVWYQHDSRAFFRIWFRQYFGLFLRHYGKLRGQFAPDDGVLTPNLLSAPLIEVMVRPIVYMCLHPRKFFALTHKVGYFRDWFLRVANRRWGKLSYDLPYPAREVPRPGLYRQ